MTSSSDHAALGGSVADIWVNCSAGGIALKTYPRSPTSFPAAEGTVAHRLLEWKLNGTAIDTIIGSQYTIDGHDIVVDRLMVEHVENVAAFMKSFAAKLVWIEQRVSLEHLGLSEPVWGTADFIALLEDGTLLVIDLKYGIVVPVTAYRNWQIIVYGLGAYLSLQVGGGAIAPHVKRLELYINQPRLNSITNYTLDVRQLSEHAGTVAEAVGKITKDDRTETPGTWCRWCPRFLECAGARQMLQDEAAVAFADAPDPVMPLPSFLSPEQISRIVLNAPLIRAYLNGCEEHAAKLMESGVDLEPFGLKLVPKLPRRQFMDEELVKIMLGEDARADGIKSPAQIEQMLGKKKFRELLGGNVSSISSGNAVAPLDDRRDAVAPVSAAEAFAKRPF